MLQALEQMIFLTNNIVLSVTELIHVVRDFFFKKPLVSLYLNSTAFEQLGAFAFLLPFMMSVCLLLHIQGQLLIFLIFSFTPSFYS